MTRAVILSCMEKTLTYSVADEESHLRFFFQYLAQAIELDSEHCGVMEYLGIGSLLLGLDICKDQPLSNWLHFAEAYMASYLPKK